METLKLALKLRRVGAPALGEAVRKVEAAADSVSIARLRRKMDPIHRAGPASAAKYANSRYWLLFNALRAAELGLHRAPSLRILDLGSGPGYFLAVARALGHDCRGVDAPNSHLTEVEREVYSELTAALRCRDSVRPLLIEPFTPLPFRDPPFDLITAFWICFNRHRQPDEWGLREWRYFVEDAFSCLRPGGKIVLDLNAHPERYGDLRYFDPSTRDYFLSMGQVNQGRVVMPASPEKIAAQRSLSPPDGGSSPS
jgi:SAM-dependent methyltransferase